MKLSIRASAFVMVLVPTLLPALGLSAWFTAERVADISAELQARGERESLYLAEASRLALLVGDTEALDRLAASNLSAPGAPRAVVFLDTRGERLAAAGAPSETALAMGCARTPTACEAERKLFSQEVRSRSADSGRGAFAAAPEAASETALGQVLVLFDLQPITALQRGLRLNAVFATLGALLVASLIGGYYARRLTGPMQRLAEVVARIQAGDLSARTVPGGAGELRALEEGVNSMADRVEESTANLSLRVDEATVELSKLLCELQERNRELDAALARAEAASQAKDMFLARMSHELRTPLSTVTGYARLMQQSESPEQRADFYRPISQASRILLRTVDDILDFVKLERGSIALERRSFDLESCIEDAVMMQAPAAHAKGLRLVCHIEAGLPAEVLGDSVRIAQVLTNVLGNAVKFTERGEVRVRAAPMWRDGAEPGAGRVCRGVLLEVSDTGIGIPADSVAQLFKPFAQADESMTRRFGGSGLGLAIVARIVEALGGEIRLDSAEGSGTTVCVNLPLRASTDDGVEEPRLHGAVVVLAEASHPQAAVLVDYLARAGLDVSVAELAAAHIHDAVKLVLVVQDAASEELQLPVGVRTLRLCPVEAQTGTSRAYLADRLPLPLRRRELLAACARMLGQAPGADAFPVDVAGEPAARQRFALRCLVVEDNDLNRRMIATDLHNLGLTVCEAAGGDEALRLNAEEDFDLVLLDVHMPGMDGITLARHLATVSPALPVYALTANVIGSEEAALAAAGVRGVLYKPVDVQRLGAILARHAEPVLSTLAAVPGIERAEILVEFGRLQRELHRALARDANEEALSFAHQLLGAARLFTRGELESWCLRLELRLRDGARSEALEACERVRRGIIALGDAPAPG